jgi:hypothetical protein
MANYKQTEVVDVMLVFLRNCLVCLTALFKMNSLHNARCCNDYELEGHYVEGSGGAYLKVLFQHSEENQERCIP